jgi:hypothetical protein
MFGPMREEVPVDWSKLHNEELHNFVIFSQYFMVNKSIEV